MSDFKNTINNKLRPVHNKASLQLFSQISNYIESSLSKAFGLSEEEKTQHLINTMLKINNFFNSEINNENTRSIIKENLLKDYDLFLNPPVQEESPVKKNEEDNINQEIE